MRAAIYARFSSELQKDTSIDDQHRVCREYADREGMTVVAAFEDRALSGSSMVRRHGLQKMVAQATAGHFDVVIVEALDRLSRDQADLATIYKRLSFKGVAIHAIHEGTADEIQIGVRGLVGALYLKDNVEKIHRGQSGVVLAGRSGGGRAYGYRPVPGQTGLLEIIEQEADIIREIFEAFVSGEKPRVIAARLNKRGVPSPRGTVWGASAIYGNHKRGSGILRNNLYDGRIVWNKVSMYTDPDTGRRISRPNDPSAAYTSESEHLRIIDRDMFDRVQSMLTATREKYAGPGRAPRNRSHMFSGMLKCGNCGGGMSIKDRRKDVIRIKCTQSVESSKCSRRTTYKLNDIYTAVVAGLVDVLSDPELVQTFVDEYCQEMHRLSAEGRRNRKSVATKLTTANRRLDRLIDALADGDTTMARVRDKMKELEAEANELEVRLAAIDADDTSRTVQLHPAAVQAYAQALAELPNTLNDPNAAPDVQEGIKALIGTIVVEGKDQDDKVAITVNGLLSSLLTPPQSTLGVFDGSGGET